MEFLDFDLEILSSTTREYVATVRSPAGDHRQVVYFPFDKLTLQKYLHTIQMAIVRTASAHRKLATTEQRTVQEFGTKLFDSLFAGQIGTLFELTRRKA